MEIINELLTFFGIDMLTESATFIDLLNVSLKIGLAIWLVAFIIRSMFLLTSLPERRMF